MRALSFFFSQACTDGRTPSCLPAHHSYVVSGQVSHALLWALVDERRQTRSVS